MRCGLNKSATAQTFNTYMNLFESTLKCRAPFLYFLPMRSVTHWTPSSQRKFRSDHTLQPSRVSTGASAQFLGKIFQSRCCASLLRDESRKAREDGSCGKLSSLQASPATHVKRGVDKPSPPCSPKGSAQASTLSGHHASRASLRVAHSIPGGVRHPRRFSRPGRPFRFVQVLRKPSNRGRA